MNKSTIKALVRKVANKTNSLDAVFTQTDNMLVKKRDVKTILTILKTQKRTTLKFPVEIRNLDQPKSIKVELISIFDDIKNGKYIADQNLLVRLIQENKLIPNHFFGVRSSYTPCGIFYHQKGRLGVRILNQIVLLSTNESSLNKIEIQRIKNDEHTFAFYRQIYANRYFLTVRTFKMHSRNFSEIQEKTEHYFSNLLGAKKLIALPLNADIPFSFDADLYYHENSIPF